MVSDKGKIAAELNEFIDVDHIRQKVAANALDLRGLLSYIIAKMSQLCAPSKKFILSFTLNE